jgi:hypothetical protein
MYPGYYMYLRFLFHCHQYSFLLWGSLRISGILLILSQLLLILSEMFLTAYAAYVKCSRIFYLASVRFSEVILQILSKSQGYSVQLLKVFQEYYDRFTSYFRKNLPSVFSAFSNILFSMC